VLLHLFAGFVVLGAVGVGVCDDALGRERTGGGGTL